MEHICNVRSTTFIGPANDCDFFRQHLKDHYPQLVHAPLSSDDADSNNCDGIVGNNGSDSSSSITGASYLGDNVLMVDSDTVWSADSTFVDINGRVQYFEAYEKKDEKGKTCTGMDPILFTKGITTGPTFLDQEAQSTRR
ncbi:hypothetical protein ACHAW5_006436 [Stephanodiscus triporus]|uniref:Uncharacterized protein n=1 Tax=Stephanodiscus triporus TaxID=2934178 RepID=A0ABD3PB32_9STRA